jgi:hypothetical protein
MDRTPRLADTPPPGALESVSEGIRRQLRLRREDAARAAEALAAGGDCTGIEVVPRPALSSYVRHRTHGVGQVVHLLPDYRVVVVFTTAGRRIYDWHLAHHAFTPAPPSR